MKRKKLPTGTLTFLFSDIESSTLRWERDRVAMEHAVQRHDAIMRAAIGAGEGHIFKTIGDAFCAAFTRPERAVAAALDAQRRLATEDFSAVNGLRVRMALHSGTADEREGDYFGPALNRVARIISIVHGGQIVISDFTSALVRNNMPSEASLLDLGRHRLKDLAEPERLYQVVAADLPREFPTLRSLELLPNNLPLQLTRFIGRDDELAATRNLLTNSRLVTLVGAGGIGKTRLALQAGAELLDGFDDGVWFVELAPVRDPEQVPGALASVLDIKATGERSITDSLVNMLRRKRSLLIFDNCEHLVRAAAMLSTAILRECREVQILATSRQPLGVSGESAHRVSSLPVPSKRTPLSKEGALQYGALALFADRASLALETFDFTDDNVGVVAQICRRLDGIALAIELAASRLKILTPEQLSSRLSERFRVLAGGSLDSLPRQQTMHALIDWSYDLLDEDEQRLFRRLCVFAGSFSLEAATAVGADGSLDEWRVFALLASLVDKSLILSEPAGLQRRYRLLESLREYAIEKARAADEVDVLRRRHADHYAAVAQRAHVAFAGSSSRMAWARELEADLDEFCAVLDWALGERANPELGAALLTALSVFWNIRGLMIAVCRWADLALAQDVSLPLQAAVWLTLGWARDHLMLPKPALDAFVRAHQLYERLDDPAGLAGALRGEGFTQVLLGDLAPGHAALQQALMLYRKLGDARQIATTLSSIAMGLKFEGRLTDARAAQLEVLELYRALRDEPNAHITILRLAETEFELGDVEGATLRARENLKQDAVRADASLFANQQSNLAGYLVAADRAEEAQEQARDALQGALDVQNHVFVAFALQHLAALIARSDPQCAGRLLGYVDSVFTASGVVRERTEEHSRERAMTLMRESLSGDQIDALIREGAALTEDQAVELAQVASTSKAGGKT